jgi:arylsulfatase A-like enzyme
MKTSKNAAVLIGVAAALTAIPLVAEAQEENPPNIVLIFADDLGYGDLGCYGATKVTTPNIDRLAAQGRMFTDAHSASAVCTPSRYALLTGEYPVRKKLSRPVFLKTGLVIDTRQQTIGTIMKDAGYATACIGKWHLGYWCEKPQLERETEARTAGTGIRLLLRRPRRQQPPAIRLRGESQSGGIGA